MGLRNESLSDKWLEDDNLMLIEAWARDGYTDKDIAERIGVTCSTLYKWKKDFEPIAKALKKGKEIIDYKVENALLKSALGYTVEETKTIISGKPDKNGNRQIRKEKTIKEIPPNVTACVIWLNNRKPDQWKRNRDNVVELSDKDSNITVNIIKHEGNTKNSNVQENENGKDEDWEVSVDKNTKGSKNSSGKKKANPIKHQNASDDGWDDVIAETEDW